MQEFVYPKDVANPIGGEGNPNIIVLEIHYDNPNGDTGQFKARINPLWYYNIIISIQVALARFFCMMPYSELTSILNRRCSSL